MAICSLLEEVKLSTSASVSIPETNPPIPEETLEVDDELELELEVNELIDVIGNHPLWYIYRQNMQELYNNRRKVSGLYLLIYGRFDVLKLVLAGGKRFAVSDHKISSRFQCIIEFIDDCIFCRHIKIDHNIPAENTMERLLEFKWIEKIKITVSNTFSQAVCYNEFVFIMRIEVFLNPAM